MAAHGLIFCVQKAIGLGIIFVRVRGVKNALEKLKKGINIQNLGYMYRYVHIYIYIYIYMWSSATEAAAY